MFASPQQLVSPHDRIGTSAHHFLRAMFFSQTQWIPRWLDQSRMSMLRCASCSEGIVSFHLKAIPATATGPHMRRRRSPPFAIVFCFVIFVRCVPLHHTPLTPCYQPSCDLQARRFSITLMDRTPLTRSTRSTLRMPSSSSS